MPPVPNSLPGLPDDYTSKFFQGDVVTKVIDSTYRGRVLRCWAEDDSVLSSPSGDPVHPLDRPLLRGEVGISDMKTSWLAIVSESSLILYQREFLKGDIVKRSLVSIESAIVVDINTEVQVEHVVTKERIRDWIPYRKLKNALPLEPRDKVVYDEWVGTIEEVFEDGLIESKDGSCYRMAEMGGFLEPGRLMSEVIPRDHEVANFHQHLPPTADVDTDRVVEVNPVVIYVTWNAINQQLPISEQDKHLEPRKFWYGPDLKKLAHFATMHSAPPALGTTVLFDVEEDENAYSVKQTMHQDGKITIRALKVVETRSRLTLRWQDGTITQDWASELVPYHNIDDYETWPGDHLIWRGDNGERRPAVVQSFNAHQRIADILFMDTNELQTVSVLELDPGGSSRTNYGVGIGQHVMLCEDNGSPLPEVPSLGQYDTQIDNMWWRNELAKLAEKFVEDPSGFGTHLPSGSKEIVTWWGEITQLHLDGTVDVTVANGEVKRVGIKNCQLLNEVGDPGMDGMEEIEGMDGGGAWIALPNGMDGMDVEVASEASWETMSNGPPLEFNPDEYINYMDEDEQDQRDIEEVDPLDSEPELDDVPTAPTLPRRESRKVNAQLSDDVEMPDAGPSSTTSSTLLKSNGNSPSPGKPSLKDDEHWQHFEMLNEAPEDHHFFKEPRNQTASKAYHIRIAKEHRALMSSLPENILVRTYGDRTDLMRCLIIGPEGTPYADAPFVFDLYLNPAKFPYEPPTVHFHSHTNGHGRCNPNLYEDGKVCLSILGTWSGDKSESWNPTKSSLLQVLVSISGLVLVRSPYHCEPAFAKLEGTREGQVNSRLYSEKAYVLSRSFVRTALERPPSGLEGEIRHLYLEKGRLTAVIEHARTLMEKREVATGGEGSGSISGRNGSGSGQAGGGADGSGLEEENEEMWNADAMGSLTMGAILSLKRIISAMEKILIQGGRE